MKAERGRATGPGLRFSVPDWCKISNGFITFSTKTISSAYQSRNMQGLLIPLVYPQNGLPISLMIKRG